MQWDSYTNRKSNILPVELFDVCEVDQYSVDYIRLPKELKPLVDGIEKELIYTMYPEDCLVFPAISLDYPDSTYFCKFYDDYRILFIADRIGEKIILLRVAQMIDIQNDPDKSRYKKEILNMIKRE